MTIFLMFYCFIVFFFFETFDIFNMLFRYSDKSLATFCLKNLLFFVVWLFKIFLFLLSIYILFYLSAFFYNPFFSFAFLFFSNLFYNIIIAYSGVFIYSFIDNDSAKKLSILELLCYMCLGVDCYTFSKYFLFTCKFVFCNPFFVMFLFLAIYFSPKVLLVFLFIVFQAHLEEMIFRRGIQRQLNYIFSYFFDEKEKPSLLRIIIVSTIGGVIFGLCHLSSSIYNIGQVISQQIAGIIFSYFTELTSVQRKDDDPFYVTNLGMSSSIHILHNIGCEVKEILWISLESGNKNIPFFLVIVLPLSVFCSIYYLVGDIKNIRNDLESKKIVVDKNIVVDKDVTVGDGLESGIGLTNQH